MGFYVGQKVVCVDGSAAYSGDKQAPPVKNFIYTISEIENDPFEGMFVSVFEIKHLPHPFGLHSCPWRASRFRPIQETQTDISIFTVMLGPKQKETVDGR